MQKEADNAVIQEKMRELTHVIQQCQEERNRSEHNLTNITKTHERIQQEQKLSPYYKSKLRERPKEALRRGALMKMLQQNALTLPLFIGKEDEKPPPLCGAIPAEPNYVAKVGDMVAALARGPDDDENWILAEVLHYSHGSAKYEVDDIDEEQKERHTLSRRRVVPLPLLRANPLTDPSALFAKGTLVMALYPQTTCFYRALVHEPPSGPQDDYLVLFEDSSYPEGYSPPLAVAQRYVICCKEMRKK
ncbi:SAGA-associated factor 29 isoform X4 [Dermacentor albipictus]|uniref:SAGA-associated factor 29 isoform X4 n=1 Tax=Dermacentor albipictus TaxID=60249 RepID=UPI002155CA22